MKICAACSRELPRENFSKKQWQAKHRRRCKDCIAVNREVQLEAPSNDNDGAPLLSSADVELERSCTDEDLFKESPPREECHICMQTLPFDVEEHIYKSCCGKVMCYGCIYAFSREDNRRLCPFCRAPAHSSDKEWTESLKKRLRGDDALATYMLGNYYCDGRYGLPQDHGKAMELWLRAGELGCSEAYNNFGFAFDNGQGVERDTKKAKYYWELGAMGGDAVARYNLGILEEEAGNMDRAMKHWMISACAGHDKSLKQIRECYLDGDATKDDFEKALRAHKEAKDEMKSDQREAARAARLRDDNV